MPSLHALLRAFSRPLALGGALGLSGCQLWPASDGFPYTTTDPVSDFGYYTQDLYALITYVVVVIFVLVSILLAVTLVRFKDDGSEGNPEQIHGNVQMEIGWTLIPVLIVLTLIIPTISTIFKIADAPPAGAMDADGRVMLNDDGLPVKPTVEIKVVGKRWWWEFEYVDSGLVTGNQFAVPDDRPVSLLITSDTVIHSFWAPRIGGKRDAVPGRINRIWFNLDAEKLNIEPGKPHLIRGECAEYCGEAHALMRFEVLAMKGDDYDKWVREQLTPPTFADASVKDKGEAAFSAAGCGGCHVVRGNDGANGRQGPDLTYFGDRKWVAAGVKDMYPQGDKTDPEFSRALLAQWIVDPNSIKPGTTADANPSRHLDGMNVPVTFEENDPRVDALVDYLLAQTSSYPLR